MNRTVIATTRSDAGLSLRGRLLGGAAAMGLRLLCASMETRRFGFLESRQARTPGTRFLYVLWHASQLLCFPLMRNRDICPLASLSVDGDIATALALGFGFTVARGSSSRGGTRALLTMLREAASGRDLALTVDGPRGPARVCKPGAAFLARRSGALIVPLGTAYSRVHRAGSWDRLEVPLPFTRAAMVAGEPFALPAGLDDDACARLIGERIDAAETEASRRLAA